MRNMLLKFSLVCATGAILITANPKIAYALEVSVAGYPYDKDKAITAQGGKDNSIISTLSEDEIPIPGFNNIGIADVKDNLNIRKGPGENETILGKLPTNGACDILEADNGSGWTKISSNKVTGYVKSEYLITGDKASKLAMSIATRVAASITDSTLNIRENPSVNSNIIDSIAKGEELVVLDPLVVTYGEEYSKWVKVSLDGDDSEDGTIGYVCKDYVNLYYSLPKASSLSELRYAGASKLRSDLVDKAMNYLGGRYVWGGTKLGSGVDCSGFTQQIYAKFGYYIPRTSASQGSGGRTVSINNLKVGDLVFYGSGSRINHVAIYIGNSKIIHASNRIDGIKISNMYYRNPIKCVRYLND